MLGGDDDAQVAPASLAGWADHTRGAFEERRFPGGHFFVGSAEGAVLEVVARTLSS